ncbi:MAG: HNH endonuclease signature motif containing protein [Pseudolysinimonas sp.]|uniref:HNH endonuclease n=1 Tax=Pseudolysinimonas sp. TaxID=2680009 RepID=UPI003C77FB05
MPHGRPALPAALKRRLLEEAGYRCAVPRCGNTAGLEFAHIVPWAESHDDSFENIIILCAVDHARYDRSGEIPRQSVRVFKANLALLRGRYNDFELRLLETFLENGLASPIQLAFGALTDINVRNLLHDGIVSRSSPQQIIQYAVPGGGMVFNPTPPAGRESQRVSGYDEYVLTDAGRQLVEDWKSARVIDANLA